MRDNNNNNKSTKSKNESDSESKSPDEKDNSSNEGEENEDNDNSDSEEEEEGDDDDGSNEESEDEEKEEEEGDDETTADSKRKPKKNSKSDSKGKSKGPGKDEVCCIVGCTERGAYSTDLLKTEMKFKDGVTKGFLCKKHYFHYVRRCRCCIYKCRYLALGEPWSRIDRTLDRRKLLGILKKNSLRDDIRHDQLCIFHYKRFFGTKHIENRQLIARMAADIPSLRKKGHKYVTVKTQENSDSSDADTDKGEEEEEEEEESESSGNSSSSSSSSSSSDEGQEDEADDDDNENESTESNEEGDEDNDEEENDEEEKEGKNESKLRKRRTIGRRRGSRGRGGRGGARAKRNGGRKRLQKAINNGDDEDYSENENSESERESKGTGEKDAKKGGREEAKKMDVEEEGNNERENESESEEEEEKVSLRKGPHYKRDKGIEDLKKAIKRVTLKVSKLKAKQMKRDDLSEESDGEGEDDSDDDDGDGDDAQIFSVSEGKHCWKKGCTSQITSTLKQFTPFEVYSCTEHKSQSEERFSGCFCTGKKNVCTLCGAEVPSEEDRITCAECSFSFCRGCIQRFSTETAFFSTLDDEPEPLSLMPFDRMKAQEQSWTCMICERCEDLGGREWQKRKARLAALKAEFSLRKENKPEDNRTAPEPYSYVETALDATKPRPSLSQQRCKKYSSKWCIRSDDFINTGGNFLRGYCEAVMEAMGAMNELALGGEGGDDLSPAVTTTTVHDTIRQLTKISFGSHKCEQELLENDFNKVTLLLQRYNFYTKLIADTPAVFKTDPDVLEAFLEVSGKIRRYLQKIDFVTGKKSAFLNEAFTASKEAQEKAQKDLKEAEKCFGDILSENAKSLAGMVVMDKGDGSGESGGSGSNSGSGLNGNDEALTAQNTALRALKKDKKKKNSDLTQQKARMEELRCKAEKANGYQAKEEQAIAKELEAHEQALKERQDSLNTLVGLRGAITQFSDVQDTFLSQLRTSALIDIANVPDLLHYHQAYQQTSQQQQQQGLTHTETTGKEDQGVKHKTRRVTGGSTSTNTLKSSTRAEQHKTVIIADPKVLASKFPAEHFNCIDKRMIVPAIIKEFGERKLVDIVDDVKEINTPVVESVHTHRYIQNLIDKANSNQRTADTLALNCKGEIEPFVFCSGTDKRMRLMPELSCDALRADIFAASGVCCAVDNILKKPGYTAAFCLTRSAGHNVGACGPAAGTTMQGPALVNPVAIGAKYLHSMQTNTQIAIVDIDAAHGSGTQEILAGIDNILMLSVHVYSEVSSPFLPGTGRSNEPGTPQNAINISLPVGADGKAWLDRIGTELIPKLEAFNPDVVFLDLGLNGLASDPTRLMKLTAADYAKATELVLGVAKRRPGCKVVTVLESVYAPIADVQACVTDHINKLIEYGNTSKQDQGEGPEGTQKRQRTRRQQQQHSRTVDSAAQGGRSFQSSTEPIAGASQLQPVTAATGIGKEGRMIADQEGLQRLGVWSKGSMYQLPPVPKMQKPLPTGAMVEQTLILQKHQQDIQEKQNQRQMLFVRYQECFSKSNTTQQERDIDVTMRMQPGFGLPLQMAKSQYTAGTGTGAGLVNDAIEFNESDNEAEPSSNNGV